METRGETICETRQWAATFGFYAPRGYYSSPEAREEIDALAATGANWVIVVATVWQDEATAVFQYRDCALTPDDLELAEIVAYARSKGLKVQLRPMLECKDGLGRLDVRLPRDVERMAGRRSTARRDWFASMAERTACYASLARRMGCDAFCIDSELDNMTEENAPWKSVVAAARREYPGPVTSCHTVHTGKVDFLKHLADPDHWFHSLDFLSLSYYCRAREEEDRGKDLSVGDMMDRLSGAHAKVEAIAKALGKPVVFGECGCGSIRDGAASPSWFSPFAEADEEEQARYMDALFGVFAREDWCLGFHWWKWDQHSPVKPGATPARTRERDFTIRGKKAEGVFSRWARGARALATVVLAAALGTVAFGASADRAPPAPSLPPIEAAATLGGGVSIADPAGMQFSPGVYSRAWKLHRATGGARIGDDPAARAFAIELSEHVGENVAAGGVRFDGRCLLSPGVEDENALDVAWSIVPDGDAAIAEAAMESRFGLARFPGGFLMDGALVHIPQNPPADIHLFRGAVSRIDALDADGNPAFSVSFRERTGVLLQDNRGLGGSSATLRFFFAKGGVKAGRTYSIGASFRVPGHAIRLRAGDRTVVEAGPDWIPVVPPAHGEDWVAPGSALDLGATLPPSAPAGRFGRVVAVGDHFEFENRPGVPQRFCGVNLCAGANTPSTPEDAERFAANLARFGFNAVRIHHHDKAWANAHASRKVEKSMSPPQDGDDIDRLDFLVAACIRHGIYLTTDLYVSRPPASWRAIGVDRDGAPSRDEFKRLVVFHEGAYSNLCDWARAFLGHVNPYTGRSLAEEPALCSLALVNEGNVGNRGRDALLATPGVREAWQAWLAEKGKPMPPDSALSAELYACADTDAKNDPTHDFALFLAESEAKFFDRMAEFVREELGCRAPLSNLSSWYNPAAYALVRSGFDYCDAHGYVDHPSFIGKQRFSLPATHPGVNPLLGGEAVPRLSWLRLFGKPFSVTEWNWAAPGKFRAASGLVMGALAARQDWSAIWRFAWSHSRDGVDAPGSVPIRFFDLHSDPATAASARAEICLFLRGDLPALPADAAAPAEYDETALRGGAGAAARIVPPPNAQSGWKKRIGVRLGAFGANDGRAFGANDDRAFDANDGVASRQMTNDDNFVIAAEGRASLPAGRAPSLPRSGAVIFDHERGALMIDTPLTCGGFVERGRIDAGALQFEICGANDVSRRAAETAANNLDLPFVDNCEQLRFVNNSSATPTAIWVSSLDGNPIATSSRMLLSHVTEAMNSGAAFDDPNRLVWTDYGKLPVLMRNGAAKVELRLDRSLVSPALSGDVEDDGRDAPIVFSLDAAGNRTGEVPCQWESGVLRFTVRTDLNPSSATFLYEIVRGNTDFPMAAGAASATTTTKETHGENHELHK